jgi:SAM-dependent methyltransferase
MNGSALPIVDDELDLLESLVPLVPARIVEPGCGAAQLARRLLQRYPQAEVVGLEVDVRQHAKNLASPAPGLTFSQAGAQRIPWPDGALDGAMTLESLLHVPVDEMDRALAKTARRPRRLGSRRIRVLRRPRRASRLIGIITAASDGVSTGATPS